MSDESSIHDLFDRWERVWHEGLYDLAPECVGPYYIRLDEAGDRTVTREAYAAEIAKIHQERLDMRPCRANRIVAVTLLHCAYTSIRPILLPSLSTAR
jgi:hypothetical protein